jgi:hypothetical protein
VLLFGQALLPVVGQQLRLLRDGIDVVGEASVTTSASSPSITARACCARAAMRLVDGDVSPVLAFHCAANAALIAL